MAQDVGSKLAGAMKRSPSMAGLTRVSPGIYRNPKGQLVTSGNKPIQRQPQPMPRPMMQPQPMPQQPMQQGAAAGMGAGVGQAIAGMGAGIGQAMGQLPKQAMSAQGTDQGPMPEQAPAPTEQQQPTNPFQPLTPQQMMMADRLPQRQMEERRREYMNAMKYVPTEQEANSGWARRRQQILQDPVNQRLFAQYYPPEGQGS